MCFCSNQAEPSSQALLFFVPSQQLSLWCTCFSWVVPRTWRKECNSIHPLFSQLLLEEILVGPHPCVAMGSAHGSAHTLKSGEGSAEVVRGCCSASCGPSHFIPVTALYKYL